jgi:hypothetical protein
VVVSYTTSQYVTGKEGALRASWLWARANLKRRWSSVVLVTVLAGLTGGFVVTALVGARLMGSAQVVKGLVPSRWPVSTLFAGDVPDPCR